MSGAFRKKILLLLSLNLTSFGSAASGSDAQVVLVSSTSQYDVDAAILDALETYKDPVDAYIALKPEMADKLAEPRLLHVSDEKEPRWATEGEKLRLKRRGKKFSDVTDYHEFYKEHAASIRKGEPNLPALSHQPIVKPLFDKISTETMRKVLEHMTSYYTRYFGSITGAQSAMWLHGCISDIIKTAPFHTHISLDVFTHKFPQPSIIARFEPKVANFSAPLTVLGAHLDSMNYLFPLLPAPGADDDGSGTVSILEAFRIPAESGYVPLNGPVEFHWYAGEEGGLLGSQPIAKYKKESGANIGAMLEFDKTAFIAKNATETIGLIETEADPLLTKWLLGLAKEYIAIHSGIYKLPTGIGSDHMSFSNLGFPTAWASEGNPITGGFNPHIHGSKDTINVDDEAGVFSLDHMARFSELAIAFAVEQAGWDNTWG